MSSRFPVFLVLTCLLHFFVWSTQAQSTFQYDSNGNLTNVAAAVGGSPTITVAPANADVVPGEDVSFSVFVSGSEPISYQWYKNGEVIQGATNGTFFLPDVTFANQGDYTVLICNGSGCVTSTVPAILDFIPGTSTNRLTFTTIKNFELTNNITGLNPSAPLVQGQDGTLYGTTEYGGIAGYNYGTLFRVNPDGTGYTEIRKFAYSDGIRPYAGLTISGNILYGTTSSGGASGYGTVFMVNTDGTGYTVLHNFSYADGSQPFSGLQLSGNTLYGAANVYGISGNSNSFGTVFKVNTDGTGFSVITYFTNSLYGQNPFGVTLSGAVLYGMTISGGTGGRGTVFKVNTDGTGYTVLHNFGGADGGWPNSGLQLSGNTLYGTTSQGGTSGNGNVFEVNTDGTGFTVLKNFAGGSDGSEPYGGVTLSGNILYGTTYAGGASGYGTVFQVKTDGTGYAILRSFIFTDGAYPQAIPILASNTLYGTTSGGGPGEGTVFALNTNGIGFQILNSYDGGFPGAGVTVSASTLYGTTSGGGIAGFGEVFQINNDGNGYKVLDEVYNPTNGTTPFSGLLLSSNMLYGANFTGGNNNYANYGTVFALNTNGTGYSVLKTFRNTPDGASPDNTLTLSGNVLYGTTLNGGTSSDGTVFKVNTDGTGFNVLKNFSGSDGANPRAGLVLSGSALYGCTYSGGPSNNGVVFMLNTNGTGYTLLKNFTNSNDGANPRATLTLSGNTLYGTTVNGGRSGYGTAFMVNTNGTSFFVIKSFKGSDGANPYAGLLKFGSSLYGTTYAGGAYNSGTIFELNTGGTNFTLLKNFIGSDGANPRSDLTLSGGILYGTTYNGGSFGVGTVYALNLGPVITNQPQNLTINAGSNATFTVGVAGDLPLSYQWFKNNSAILNGGHVSGATAATLTISNVFVSDPGNYQVVITNAFGSMTSVVATLAVTGLPSSITSWNFSSAGFQLQFTGSATNLYTILASTNLALPLLDWSNLGGPSLLSNDLYEFIDTQSAAFPVRFYMLRSP